MPKVRAIDLARGAVAAVEEYRAVDRLQRIGEDRRAFRAFVARGALVQAQERARCRARAPMRGQRFLADQAGAHPRQLALGQLRMALEQQLGHGAAEHAVAEELEPLVVRRAEAAVRERLREQRGILEAVADAPLEYRMAGHRRARAAIPWMLAWKSMYTPTLREQRDLLAVGDGDHQFAAVLGDFEVLARDRCRWRRWSRARRRSCGPRPPRRRASPARWR